MSKSLQANLILLALALAAAAFPSTAQSCPAIAATDAEAAACRAEALRTRLDELVKTDTPEKRLARGGAPSPAPYVLQYSDTDFTVGTSLATIGGFADFDAARRLEEARARLGPAVAMPKPAPLSPTGFDAWTSVKVLEMPAIAPGMPLSMHSGSVQALHGTVGADYKLDRNAVLGFAAGIDQRASTSLGDGGAEGSLAAFFAIKGAGSNLDLRARHIDTSAFATPSRVAASQDALSARLDSTLELDAIRFTPAVTVATGIEHAAGENPAIARSMVELAPVVSVPMALPGGGKIEPFVTYRTGLEEIDGPAGAATELARSTGAGAGVKLTRKGSTLSATADVDHLHAADQRPEVKSRFEVKVPLP